MVFLTCVEIRMTAWDGYPAERRSSDFLSLAAPWGSELTWKRAGIKKAADRPRVGSCAGSDPVASMAGFRLDI